MRSFAVWSVLGLVVSAALIGCSSGSDTSTAPLGAGGFSGDSAAGGSAPDAGGSSTGGTMQEGGSSGQAGASGGSGSAGDAGSGGTGATATLTVLGDLNQISLEACGAIASSTVLAAGVYTARLDLSSLSKGSVDNAAKDPSVDNYVVVHLPEGTFANGYQRFFMLNGLGAQRAFNLDQAGAIQLFFIDSDSAANHGSATISLQPGDLALTVDATANVIAWRDACHAEPARLWVEPGQHELRLAASTMTADGVESDYVLLRLPSEVPDDDHRYVILNGVGSTHHFAATEAGWIRGWSIAAAGVGAGQATVVVSPP